LNLNNIQQQLDNLTNELGFDITQTNATITTSELAYALGEDITMSTVTALFKNEEITFLEKIKVEVSKLNNTPLKYLNQIRQADLSDKLTGIDLEIITKTDYKVSIRTANLMLMLLPNSDKAKRVKLKVGNLLNNLIELFNIIKSNNLIINANGKLTTYKMSCVERINKFKDIFSIVKKEVPSLSLPRFRNHLYVALMGRSAANLVYQRISKMEGVVEYHKPPGYSVEVVKLDTLSVLFEDNLLSKYLADDLLDVLTKYLSILHTLPNDIVKTKLLSTMILEIVNLNGRSIRFQAASIDDIRNWFNSQRYLQMTEENKEIKLKELLKYLKQSSKHYTITDLVGEVNNY